MTVFRAYIQIIPGYAPVILKGSPLCANIGTHLYPESTILITEIEATGVCSFNTILGAVSTHRVGLNISQCVKDVGL